MDAPKITRSVVRKKLCLKSTLDRCEYDPTAKVYFRNVATTPPRKQATMSPQADDDFNDFKSPPKASSKPKRPIKRRVKMPIRPYSYPYGCASTQDMFAAEWVRAGAGETEYLSENEFEAFKDERKREALLQNKAEYRKALASAKIEESSNQQTEKLKSAEANSTFLEHMIPGINGCSVESGGAKTPVESSPPNGLATSKKKSSDSLRSELRNMKIENVIIPDSELSEDEVLSSQLPNAGKLKTSWRQDGKLKSSKASEGILCIKESASMESKLASSIPLKILPSYQLGVNKTNSKNDMVALSKVDKMIKKEPQLKKEHTPKLLKAKIHPMHMCPSTKLPLQPSVIQSTESEWRVEELSTALKPSRINSKFCHFKKARFSRIRSLRWKAKMVKRQRIFD